MDKAQKDRVMLERIAAEASLLIESLPIVERLYNPHAFTLRQLLQQRKDISNQPTQETGKRRRV